MTYEVYKRLMKIPLHMKEKKRIRIPQGCIFCMGYPANGGAGRMKNMQAGEKIKCSENIS